MPSFDGGHYFLTALIPIRSEPMAEDGVFTSPVHALRKRLSLWPATPTLHFPTTASPFAKSATLHFARFVVIDDVAYNGRVGSDPLVAKVLARRDPKLGNPVIAQEQDHLTRPYLLLAMDFDAVDGRDATRDAFLRGLWQVMAPHLREVLRYAVGFEKIGGDAIGFATYIADCQIETTMPFNDYYLATLGVEDWTKRTSTKTFIYAGIGGAGGFGLGLVGLLVALVALVFGWPLPGFALVAALLLVLGFIVLGLTITAAVGDVDKAGGAPFPAGIGTTLPNILKSLYLQRAFTQFAIDNQVAAARDGPEADAALHASFGAFLKQHQPSDLAAPTQAPGVLGI